MRFKPPLHSPLADTSTASLVLSRGRKKPLLSIPDSPVKSNSPFTSAARQSPYSMPHLEPSPSLISEHSPTKQKLNTPPSSPPLAQLSPAALKLLPQDKINILLSVAAKSTASSTSSSPTSVQSPFFIPELEKTAPPPLLEEISNPGNKQEFRLKIKTKPMNPKKKTPSVASGGRDAIKGLKHSELWDAMFKRLEKFKAEKGHCQVPRDYKNDPRLAKWVVNQRCRKDSTSSDRIERLNSIGFVWRVRHQSPRELWDEKYNRLAMYKALHGDCLVPSKYEADPSLGRWVHAQRFNRKLLHPERRQKLDELGFVWSVNHDTWEVMFHRLASYQREFGHCEVPREYKYPKLRSWVLTQRSRQELLSQTRKDRLNTLGFDWGC